MKKLLALVLVLGMASIGMASVASAAFVISVDGVVDPPDTSIELWPSDYAIIDIHGMDNTGDATAMWLVCQGPGTINGGVITYAGTSPPSELTTLPGADWEDMLGFLWTDLGLEGVTSVSYINIGSTESPQPLLNGMLVDDILFHCEGEGDVLLTLFNGNLDGVYDTQIIHQIPEPMTMALLALGGLGLLRRRRA